jgi:hypothetical protein
MGPSELLCPGAFDAVKMALDTGSYLSSHLNSLNIIKTDI